MLSAVQGTAPVNPVEAFIARYADLFRAPRGHKFVHAGGRGMQVRTAGEKVLHLPNGAVVKVTTDDSGKATQVEEAEHMHAIARPATLKRRWVNVEE